MALVVPQRIVSAYDFPPSFDAWRKPLGQTGIRPVIAVAGSRGKSTVVRLLDAILATAGLRTATWTDFGVEIERCRQRGELLPWSRALAALDGGALDVAILEVAWSTVPTIGQNGGPYPIVVVTNVCANREACLLQSEAKRAMQALPTLLNAVQPHGVVVLNGEDYAVCGDELRQQRPHVLVAVNRDSPPLRAHAADGGVAAWVGAEGLFVGPTERPDILCRPADLRFALDGAAGFQLHNALSAAAAAMACGIPADIVGAALHAFDPPALAMPRSLNVLELRGTMVIVDRPEPSWFLRPVLRAVRDLSRNRLLTVVGRLAPVPDSDIGEVGRLLGRLSSVLVVHSESDRPERLTLFRQGVTLNHVPPVILHTPSERRALTRSLSMARPRDVLLVLADQPATVLRTLARAARLGEPRSA